MRIDLQLQLKLDTHENLQGIFFKDKTIEFFFQILNKRDTHAT